MELQIRQKCEIDGQNVNDNSLSQSLMRVMYFQCNFMEEGCVGLLLWDLPVLNDTGMLMYDIAAPFPGSFPHMVNSFSQHVSGQFTDGTEALFRWDFCQITASAAAP